MAREYKLPPRPGAQSSGEELEDLSPMPFGKYGPKPKGEGRIMQDVPAGYLLWLWESGVWQQPVKPIHHYIKKSFSALEKDAPDFHNPTQTMNRTPVKSSQLASIGHDPATNKLHVEFKNKDGKPGSVYEYDNFTAADHKALMAAPSTGSHFYKHIKPFKEKHPYRKIG